MIIYVFSPSRVTIKEHLPGGGVHPDGAGPSCLGGVGMREGGISLSTNLNSSVDSMMPPDPSAGLFCV